jgi:hypothetical protein
MHVVSVIDQCYDYNCVHAQFLLEVLIFFNRQSLTTGCLFLISGYACQIRIQHPAVSICYCYKCYRLNNSPTDGLESLLLNQFLNCNSTAILWNRR